VPLTDHIYRPESLERVLGVTGVRVTKPDLYVKVHRVLGLDLIATYIDGGDVSFTIPEGAASEVTDDWGIKWRIIDNLPWYVDGSLKTPEDFENFNPPDPDDQKWFASAEGVVKLVKGDMAVATLVEGPFTRVWYLTGLPTFMKALYMSPKSLRNLIEKMTKFQIELGKGYIDRGVDVIWLDEDLGDVKGPLIRPALFREYIAPSLRQMVNAFKAKGARTLIHSDGNVMAFIEDFIGMGIDGLHPLERTANMSLSLIKERYGDKLTLIGNVNAKTVLQDGPLEAIENQVKECIRDGAKGGGYILASDHSIHPGISAENVKFMFEAARKYGSY
jgi:uroporphyrinogen decarboxylase